MGCFSFMCKECGKAILSTSFSGQSVKLFLLHNGKVIDQMEGEYDSYGRVFTNGNKESIDWKDPFPDAPLHESPTKDGEPYKLSNWSKVCDLMFSVHAGDGIAAIHTKCWKGKVPTTRSDDDPNQGWGEDLELLGDTSQVLKD